MMAEAMASGTPVAAFPVPGPLDVLADGAGGALDDDLDAAVARALDITTEDCVRAARPFEWSRCVDQFLAGLALIDQSPAIRLAA